MGLTAALCGFLGVGAQAIAIPISGSIGFYGGAVLDDASIADATGVSTWNMIRVFGVTPGSSLDTTVDIFDSVTMADGWSFDSPQTALWSVGGFTFDLTSSWIVAQNSAFVSVAGTGVLHGNGFEATLGEWYFTSFGNDQSRRKFTFSATDSIELTIPTNPSVPNNPNVPSVPDGGTTLLLLGGGMVAVASLARFRRKAA